RYLAKDGRVVWGQSTAAAVRNPDGKLRFVLSMVEDITERRQLAHEMLSVSERERQRFGQDLHDGLCQHLIGLKFRSALLEKKLRQQSSPDAEAAKAVVVLLDQAIQEAHDLAQGLHPVKLEADGLMCALQDLAANTESLFSVPCRCRF